MLTWKELTAPGEIVTRHKLLERLRELVNEPLPCDKDDLREHETLLLRYLNDDDIKQAYIAASRGECHAPTQAP